MPLVRIDIAKSHPPGFGRAVGEVVYRAMLSEISVPADDKFQIITTHETSELNIPTSYLGITYSPGIV
ncbi:MAG: tautomerase family protein, partial [Burkholderiaceae bacterium]